MKLFEKCKDGGKDSPADGYFLIEIKGLFSVAFLKFNKGKRGVFHTHAFDAYTWFLKGYIIEEDVDGSLYVYKSSLFPKRTLKSKNHRVMALEDSWCFTLRGTWEDNWSEYNKILDETTVFSWGRNIVKKVRGVL